MAHSKCRAPLKYIMTLEKRSHRLSRGGGGQGVTPDIPPRVTSDQLWCADLTNVPEDISRPSKVIDLALRFPLVWIRVLSLVVVLPRAARRVILHSAHSFTQTSRHVSL